MREAAGFLSGTHDFRAFTVSPSVGKQLANTVRSLKVSIEDSKVILQEYKPVSEANLRAYNFIFEANGFLYKQVYYYKI